MNLVNKQVTHKIFGKGTITRHDKSYVEIVFPSEPSEGNVLFVFPDAFGPYLTLVDQKTAVLVEKKNQKRKRERDKKLKLKKQQYHLEREARANKRKTRKIHPSSQSVFWCQPEELDNIFTEWNIFTGKIKSGQNKGQPRRLARVNQNSACLLTVREPDMPEKDRRILGAFMVDEIFSAKMCVDGYIPAHSKYRLRLSEQESEKMLFWNYYVNKRYPHKMTWNTGRHRYFDNEWMANILRDIVSLKKEPQEKKCAQSFFEYFCQMNGIDKEALPKPEGSLSGNKSTDQNSQPPRKVNPQEDRQHR